MTVLPRKILRSAERDEVVLGKWYPGTGFRRWSENLQKRSYCLHKFSEGFLEFPDMTAEIPQYPDKNGRYTWPIQSGSSLIFPLWLFAALSAMEVLVTVSLLSSTGPHCTVCTKGLYVLKALFTEINSFLYFIYLFILFFLAEKELVTQFFWRSRIFFLPRRLHDTTRTMYLAGSHWGVITGIS